jgi:prepilin-type processing-associated H-X9-DG protein
MMVAETQDRPGPWTAGGPSTLRAVDPRTRPYLGPGRPFGGLHRKGTMVLMADGSARFVPNATPPPIFEAMATIAGGEPTGLPGRVP